MPVPVPNVVGLNRGDAEKKLTAERLRHIIKITDAAGDGRATQQSPVAGTLVPVYSVVTVTIPGFGIGPPESPEDGPTPSGNLEGVVNRVRVDQGGAWIDFLALIEGDVISISVALYRDQRAELLPRAEWMRRGAMLGLVQRALTNNHNVRLFTADNLIQSIEILKS